MAPDNIIYDLYSSRFLSDDVVAGDQIRSDQFAILMESFMKSPILGQGIGYGADAMIRDPEAPYSYEIQWLAMLMQFGIIGFLLIFSIYLSPIMLLNKNMNKVSISIIVIYLITLVSGFSNPYLLSSQFSLIYSTIFISLLYVKGVKA
jgi:O-antigen ligase